MIRVFVRALRFLLLPFRNFFYNLLFLFRYKLEDENISTNNIHSYLDNIKYEIEEDLKSLSRPEIENPLATIDEIITQKKSVCRFGDGEFELLEGRSIEFQKSSLLLTERLHEILNSDIQSTIICIPHYFWYSVKDCNTLTKTYTRKTISVKRNDYEKVLAKSKKYYATEFTQLYMTYSASVNLSNYFERLKNIWSGRDVTLIQGEGITKNFTYNIFDGAKSLEYNFAPSKNAFFDYSNILERAKTIDKNRLILIILGPTATILAYDLANMGYQAIDIGHTAKDYEFYKKGIEKNSATITKFYEAD